MLNATMNGYNVQSVILQKKKQKTKKNLMGH